MEGASLVVEGLSGFAHSSFASAELAEVLRGARSLIKEHHYKAAFDFIFDGDIEEYVGVRGGLGHFFYKIIINYYLI